MMNSKECVAVFTLLYKKNGAVSCFGFYFSLTGHLQEACTMECRKAAVIPGYPVGLDLVMGKSQ